MSKQLLINERPADSTNAGAQPASNTGGVGTGGGDDWPKASIGNYKGVMLCNRPNELGQQRRPERGGMEPFLSRVNPADPTGWNPCKRPQLRRAKKNGKTHFVTK